MNGFKPQGGLGVTLELLAVARGWVPGMPGRGLNNKFEGLVIRLTSLSSPPTQHFLIGAQLRRVGFVAYRAIAEQQRAKTRKV